MLPENVIGKKYYSKLVPPRKYFENTRLLSSSNAKVTAETVKHSYALPLIEL